MKKIIFNTSGDGYWSRIINAQVRITDMKLGRATLFPGDTEKDMYGELRVYFDTKTWDIYKHGLIYTDSLFLDNLQEFLDAHGLPGDDVSYSEQGMQGDDFVSCDVGPEFYKAWMQKFNISVLKLVDFI